MRNASIVTDSIKKSKIICIFGMSLGETDLTWWEQIAAWLQQDPKNQLVIFNWLSDWNPALPHIFLKNEEDIWKHFFRLTSFPESEQETFESRIQVIPNSNLFKIKLTGEENKVLE